jgi:hypothetical protein
MWSSAVEATQGRRFNPVTLEKGHFCGGMKKYGGTGLAQRVRIFAAYEDRIVALEAMVADLQARPAARVVEHQRDSHGQVVLGA